MSIRTATAIRIVVALLLVAGLAVVGYLVTVEIADYQREQYFEVRKFQDAAAAASIDYHDVEALKGDESDLDTPAYKKLWNQLRRIKESDSRIRYAYLMRPKDGKMIFLVDAEDPGSKDFSPPGQVYYEAEPQEFEVFEGKKRPAPWMLGPITDRWGTWISANAYVVDSKGVPIALMGTDVEVNRALSSFNDIKNIGFLYVVLAAVMLSLVCAQWIVMRYNRDRREALRRHMEDSIIRLNSELIEADRLKSEFLEAASHELRAPVTAVDGALAVMEHQLSGEFSPEGLELLDVARTGSRRLVDLVNNLLDLTRIEAGGITVTPTPIDMDELVHAAVKLFGALAMEKGLVLQAEVEPPGATTRVDPEVVRRVLENLVSNAIKYTESGKVTVTAKVAPEAVALEVADTGRGIPERFRAEVFKKFSRLHLSTDSRERGAGLGLAISKGLIDAHGGSISVESTEGEGTTIHVEIPVSSGEGPGEPDLR
ncbi:MAG: HAMP domain-containing sensor histidine kinase [Actinomycetota bacterium]